MWLNLPSEDGFVSLVTLIIVSLVHPRCFGFQETRDFRCCQYRSAVVFFFSKIFPSIVFLSFVVFSSYWKGCILSSSPVRLRVSSQTTNSVLVKFRSQQRVYKIQTIVFERTDCVGTQKQLPVKVKDFTKIEWKGHEILCGNTIMSKNERKMTKPKWAKLKIWDRELLHLHALRSLKWATMFWFIWHSENPRENKWRTLLWLEHSVSVFRVPLPGVCHLHTLFFTGKCSLSTCCFGQSNTNY